MAVEDLVEEEHPVAGEIVIPPWARAHMNESDLAAVEAQIQASEKLTQGEIVPVIVRSSGSYQYARYYLAAMAFQGGLMSEVYALNQFEIWPHIVSGAFFILAPILFWVGGFDFFKRFFTREDELEKNTFLRAELEFYRNKVSKTEQKTGILIFASLTERKCVVLADQGIAQFYPPETWTKLVSELSQSLHGGQWREGFKKAIQEAGEILGAKIPPDQKNENELANHLIFRE